MTGKVAIITGGSQGIGAGLVAGYRARGWSVVASGRSVKPTGDPEVLAVEGDLADLATADRIISAALERFGRIDTLVRHQLSRPETDVGKPGRLRRGGPTSLVTSATAMSPGLTQRMAVRGDLCRVLAMIRSGGCRAARIAGGLGHPALYLADCRRRVSH